MLMSGDSALLLDLQEVRAQVKDVERYCTPLATFGYEPVFFDVYRVKMNEYTPLHPLLCHARGSYLVYGDIPAMDQYDLKSFIYMCRVRYTLHSILKGKDAIAEEWFSVRYVPGCGDPLGTPDFDEIKNSELLRNHIGGGYANSGDSLDSVVTISKICRIPPFYKEEEELISSEFSQSLHYTSLSLAFCSLVFFKSCAANFDYVTGIFRDELIQKSLTVSTGSALRVPMFVPAYKTLGLESIGDIFGIDRSKAAYQYPAYFLQMGDMVSVLGRLISDGLITKETLDHYCDGRPTLQHLEDYPQISRYNFRKLGKLLSVDGGDNLHGGKISAEQLRKILDDNVRDGPQLMMMKISDWQMGLWRAVWVQHVISVLK